jgi:hypothetical protein
MVADDIRAALTLTLTTDKHILFITAAPKATEKANPSRGGDAKPRNSLSEPGRRNGLGSSAHFRVDLLLREEGSKMPNALVGVDVVPTNDSTTDCANGVGAVMTRAAWSNAESRTVVLGPAWQGQQGNHQMGDQ